MTSFTASLVESFVQVFEEIQSPIRLFDPRPWRFLLLTAPFIYVRPMTPCHCSDVELTLARFQLLEEQRKEDSLHCEQDMHLKKRGVVFAIASDLPSLHLETRQAASAPAHPHNMATPTFFSRTPGDSCSAATLASESVATKCRVGTPIHSSGDRNPETPIRKR